MTNSIHLQIDIFNDNNLLPREYILAEIIRKTGIDRSDPDYVPTDDPDVMGYCRVHRTHLTRKLFSTLGTINKYLENLERQNIIKKHPTMKNVWGAEKWWCSYLYERSKELETINQ